MEYINIAYVVSAICFIMGIKMLSHPKTARRGNIVAAMGMLIAIVSTLFGADVLDFKLIAIGMIIGAIIGGFVANKIEMTQMPQMVAIFNGLGGGASALIASAEFYVQYQNSPTTFLLVTIILSVVIGTLTLTGSFIAFGKLQGLISGKPITYPGQQLLNGVMVIALVCLGTFIVNNPSGFFCSSFPVWHLYFL